MQETRKRPIGISILTVVGFIICACQIILISNPAITDIGQWYPVVYGFLTAFKFIALVGVWHMKKWGPELFLYSFLLKITVQIAVGDYTIFAVMDTPLSILLIVVYFAFYRRMSRNL